MHKFSYSMFKKPVSITRLEVHSFEMNVYLIKLTIGERTGYVYDKNDNIMRFHNTQQVREFFSESMVQDCVMVHSSPYEEMVGNPSSAAGSMTLPFSMEQPY